MPFDRSAADLTGHALRALFRWRRRWAAGSTGSAGTSAPSGNGGEWRDVVRVIDRAIERGFAFLGNTQREDGSWLPLWFGNQANPDEENPVYGTSRVLLAYAETGRLEEPAAARGVEWLVQHQNTDGGWGGEPDADGRRLSSVEETGVAVEALWSVAGGPRDEMALAHLAARAKAAARRGTAWLVSAVEQSRHRECSPIGFYFAKLWYYEKLYPLIFCTAALGRAAAQCAKPPSEADRAERATAERDAATAAGRDRKRSD